MTYLQTHFWPEGTEEQYQATVSDVHRDGRLPAGQRSHVAGPTEGGFTGQPVERAADVAHDEAS